MFFLLSATIRLGSKMVALCEINIGNQCSFDLLCGIFVEGKWSTVWDILVKLANLQGSKATSYLMGREHTGKYVIPYAKELGQLEVDLNVLYSNLFSRFSKVPPFVAANAM